MHPTAARLLAPTGVVVEVAGLAIASSIGKNAGLAVELPGDDIFG